MRNFKETLNWYKTHQTTRQIGFNPDGMCLKVCRTARGIGAKYPTAKAAQDATPKEHRVYRVRDLRRGMVLYYDDPRDSNRAGHIVTMIGRVRGYDPDKLSDILVETNSVKRGELVVVRGDYFERFWGDDFKFGATWLNGQKLDIPKPTSRVALFHRSGPRYNLKHLDRAIREGRREGLRDERDFIVRMVGMLPAEKRSRVAKFVQQFREDRILDMELLNDAVVKGERHGTVSRIQTSILDAIKKLPRS